VQAGALFFIKSVDVQMVGPMGTTVPDIGLAPGTPFSADTLVGSQNQLVRDLTKKGFPFAKVTDRRIIVDHEDHSVAVTLFVNPGPWHNSGPPDFRSYFCRTVVRNTLPWTEGEIFNADLLDAGQKKLASLGLFSLIRVLPAQDLDENGRLPVNVILTERKHRSVSAGVSYKTDEGPGVSASWENRNLAGESNCLSYLF
jgi:translocation and assembly module TamA